MRSRGAHAELEGSRTVPKTPAVLGAIPNGFANRQTLDRRFAVRAAPTKPSRKSLTLESLLRRREQTAARPAPTVRSAPIGHWLIGEPGWQKTANGTLMWLDRVLAEADADAERPH